MEGEEGREGESIPDSQCYQGTFAVSVGPLPWCSRGSQPPVPTALQGSGRNSSLQEILTSLQIESYMFIHICKNCNGIREHQFC